RFLDGREAEPDRVPRVALSSAPPGVMIPRRPIGGGTYNPRMRPLHFVRGALALLANALGGCGGSLPPDVPRPPALHAPPLDGEWQVLGSNFPMWLDGTKTEPTFMYRSYRDGDRVRMSDTVLYRVKGERKTIVGVDTQDPSWPAHFTWRGKGILGLFSSDW